MIKLETSHIEEVRGIRNLDIDFQKATFVISGPNGSGKKAKAGTGNAHPTVLAFMRCGTRQSRY
jgi:hypothetical protein